MASRTPIVGGNWKMNTDLASARSLAAAVRELASTGVACEIAVFPPFPYLQAAGELLAGSAVLLGSQDVYHQPNGAFTGEVSTAMLLDLGVQIVLAGHSERRHVIGEDDALVNRKLLASLDAGLRVVLCVGETLEQREAGQTEQVNLGQLQAALEGVDEAAMSRVVVAYEPVWAIGTGKTAQPEDAQAVHTRLREAVGRWYNQTIADSLQIQYGGSVKGNNAPSLFAQPDIDGGLIGGASLDVGEFTSIVQAASTAAGR